MRLFQGVGSRIVTLGKVLRMSTVSTQHSNRKLQQLDDLTDLDIEMIQAVANSFIQQYGNLDAETGNRLVAPHQTSMANELRRMMSQPELGIRQVIPLIAMWVEQYGLRFDDPLFKLELSRLRLKQELADQLNRLVALKRPATVKFSVLEVLAMLDRQEMMESVPYIEFQVNQQLSQPPKDVSELIERIRELSKYSERFIEIKLTPDMYQKLEKSEESLEQKAKKWLEKTQSKYQYNLNAFFKEYDKLPKQMKEAVNEIMDENIQKAAKMQQRVPLASEEYYDTYTLIRRVLLRILKWFQRD